MENDDDRMMEKADAEYEHRHNIQGSLPVVGKVKVAGAYSGRLA